MTRWLAFLVFLVVAFSALAQEVLPVPELTARVIDQTGTLDDIQRKALEDKLAAFEQSKGTQIVVLMVPTTQPEDIFSYANRVAGTWKIGRRDVGDGILVIVAKNDRRVRIEVARTLEGAVPDLAAKIIIDEAITPAFARGDFAGGLQAGVDRLIARITGEALPAPERQRAERRGAAGFNWFDLAIFVFFAVPIAGSVLRTMLGRKLGAVVTGGGVGLLALLFTSSIVVAVIAAIVALLFTLLSGGGPPGGMGSGGRSRSRGWGAPVILPGSGWGGGRGGWGGGGGFSSGGGGSFGGGGASGGW